jgi:hypothetical protein
VGSTFGAITLLRCFEFPAIASCLASGEEDITSMKHWEGVLSRHSERLLKQSQTFDSSIYNLNSTIQLVAYSSMELKKQQN